MAELSSSVEKVGKHWAVQALEEASLVTQLCNALLG